VVPGSGSWIPRAARWPAAWSGRVVWPRPTRSCRRSGNVLARRQTAAGVRVLVTAGRHGSRSMPYGSSAIPRRERWALHLLQRLANGELTCACRRANAGRTSPGGADHGRDHGSTDVSGRPGAFSADGCHHHGRCGVGFPSGSTRGPEVKKEDADLSSRWNAPRTSCCTGKRKGRPLLVGFAAETENLEATRDGNWSKRNSISSLPTRSGYLQPDLAQTRTGR